MNGPLKVKVVTVSDSVGIVLPEQLIARLKIASGDTLTLTETPNGYALIYEGEFEEIMAVSRRGARKYRNALRALADK